MKELILNTNEIESVWEKDNLCFVRMNSGKVWLCNQYKDFSVSDMIGYSVKTIDYIKENKGLICLPLSVKGGNKNGK